MSYPCNACNMDEGSPVCVGDSRCKRGPLPERDRMLASDDRVGLPPELAQASPTLTYAAWRITFQAGEPAARAAWHEWCRVAAREGHLRACLRDAKLLCAHYAQLLHDALHQRRTSAPGPVLVCIGWSDGRQEEREFDHWPDRSELPADAVRFDIAWPDLRA